MRATGRFWQAAESARVFGLLHAGDGPLSLSEVWGIQVRGCPCNRTNSGRRVPDSTGIRGLTGAA